MKKSWIAAIGVAAVALTSATALAEPPWDHSHERTEWVGPRDERPVPYERGYDRGYWEGEHARDRDYARIARWERYRRWEYFHRMRDHRRW